MSGRINIWIKISASKHYISLSKQGTQGPVSLSTFTADVALFKLLDPTIML